MAAKHLLSPLLIPQLSQGGGAGKGPRPQECWGGGERWCSWEGAINKAEIGVKWPEASCGATFLEAKARKHGSGKQELLYVPHFLLAICSLPLLHHPTALLTSALGWLKEHGKTCPALHLVSLIEKCSALCPAFPFLLHLSLQPFLVQTCAELETVI